MIYLAPCDQRWGEKAWLPTRMTPHDLTCEYCTINCSKPMWRIVRGHELRDACDRASSGLSGTKTYSKHATKHKLKQSDPRDTTARHTWRPLRRVMPINNPYFYINRRRLKTDPKILAPSSLGRCTCTISMLHDARSCFSLVLHLYSCTAVQPYSAHGFSTSRLRESVSDSG